MKHQIPTSKLQRSFNIQAPNGTIFEYPSAKLEPWSLKEDSGGNGDQPHPFDLEERTALFGEAIIRFCKKIPYTPENNRLIDQLVGCGTSVGANYCEANEGVSKKDFKNTIGRCVKEAKETKFFLRMIAASEPALADEARKLYREAKELHLIFASIFRK
jgi:four helix bundle protein